MSIMTIGDCVLDYYPELNERYIGGSGLNTAVYLKDKNIDTDLFGLIGNDVDGRRILDYLKHKRFDLTTIKVREGKTPQAIIKKGEAEDYEIKYVKEGVKKKHKLEVEDIKAVKDYDIVHTNIYSHTLHLLPYLKDQNNLVSFDYSFKLDFDKLVELEDYIDILFVSKSDIVKKEFEKLKRSNIDYIVLSSASKGFIFIYNGEEYFREPLGEYIKDSTGAGDTLTAELLAGILKKDKEIKEIMDNAAEMAYKTCLEIGPFHSF